MDALPYIDVTAPYFALSNLSILPTKPDSTGEGVGCIFYREQPNGSQITYFSGAEIARHLAILGSVVAARVNPVKQKHYYLALEANVQMTGIQGRYDLLRAYSYVTKPDYKKGRVTSSMTAYTSDGKVYATQEIQYAILPEDRLLKSVRPMDKSFVFGTPWKVGQPSAYTNPDMLRLLRRTSPTSASAIISLHDTALMSGHFIPLPAAPLAVLAANALALYEYAVPGSYYVADSFIICSPLAVGREVLLVEVHPTVEADEVPGMTHRVTFTDEKEQVVGCIYMCIEPTEKVVFPKL